MLLDIRFVLVHAGAKIRGQLVSDRLLRRHLKDEGRLPDQCGGNQGWVQSGAGILRQQRFGQQGGMITLTVRAKAI